MNNKYDKITRTIQDKEKARKVKIKTASAISGDLLSLLSTEPQQQSTELIEYLLPQG